MVNTEKDKLQTERYVGLSQQTDFKTSRKNGFYGSRNFSFQPSLVLLAGVCQLLIRISYVFLSRLVVDIYSRFMVQGFGSGPVS